MVDWAMRYGNPSISSRLEAMQKAGCDRILVVPLYPQYAAATTATVCDKVFQSLETMRWQPALRVAPPWFDDPAYIGALAASLEASLAKLPFQARRGPCFVSWHAGRLCDEGRSLPAPVRGNRAAAAQ